MKIWKLIPKANDYENLYSLEEFDLDRLQSFDGRSKAEGWRPWRFRPLEGNMEWGDMASYHTHIPTVTPNFIEATRDLIESSVEILPIDCEGKELYLLNTTEVLDCIDYTKAKPITFTNSSKIMMFEKYAFIEEKVKGKHFFKIKELPVGGVFVSDEFRQRTIDKGLVGIRFDLVWDSEAE